MGDFIDQVRLKVDEENTLMRVKVRVKEETDVNRIGFRGMSRSG